MKNDRSLPRTSLYISFEDLHKILGLDEDAEIKQVFLRPARDMIVIEIVTATQQDLITRFGTFAVSQVRPHQELPGYRLDLEDYW